MQFAKYGCLVVASLLLLAVPLAAAQPRPNIVFIMADDLGYGDLSCLNEESKIKTPRLDRMAAQGMTFTDAHSGSSVCTPTRYGVVTGRYAWRSRLKRGVLGGSSKHLINTERETVASMLKKQGYHTAMIGKWHLGWDFQSEAGKGIDYSKPVQNGPDALGFDYYYGHCGSLDMAPYVYVENGRITAAPDRVTSSSGKKMWRKGPTGADFKHIDVLPNFINRGIKYIDEQAKSGEPFFLYLPLPAPHTPILPTEEFVGKSKTNLYGDFVLQVDHHVGQILDALTKNGIAENTLVIFTSDNGCSPKADFKELAAVGHHPSYKYRGHKADIFEGGHRVPYIVRWPSRVEYGSVSHETICLTDLMATVAQINGIKLADNAGEDSVSILPALLGKKQQLREATVHHSINGSFAIRKGNWKLCLCPGSGGWSNPKPSAAYAKKMPPVQLYDLKNDAAEKNNVAKQNPEKVQELVKLLQKYVTEGRSTPGEDRQNEGNTTFLPRDWQPPNVRPTE